MAKKQDPKEDDDKNPLKKGEKPRVNKDLKGFEISINQFGEIKSNLKIESINEFLNENVDDKKLAERQDYEAMKKGKKKKK